MENLYKLIQELCKYSNETQWIEYKHDNYDPDMIGQDICALANGATLAEKQHAYFLWGIDDNTHDIVGTDNDLQKLKKGNEELENWLRGSLSSNVDFEYRMEAIDGINVGILIINCATNMPATFKKVEYIRVGSYTKKLMDVPSVQARLWNKLQNNDFERQPSIIDLELSSALRMIDYGVYFDLTGSPIPETAEGIVHYLLEENILIKQDNGLYSITNLGAILFAKRLSDFSKLSRKAIRIVQYDGNNKMSMLRDDVGTKGYAVGFEDVVRYIEALTPSKEIINGVFREKKTAYPALAIREAVANALIHQDFSVSGTGPTVEIFNNRIEITNAGIPLVDIYRIIDNPPKSRNEKLASIMRRLKMCEELGTGWDKIVITSEMMQLPAPRIELFEESTKVTLFAEMPYSSLSMENKLWACYLHACIQHIQGEQLTNSSLRRRFGLKESSAGNVSRLIKEALDVHFIKPLDPETAPRYMKYVPIWA